MAWSGGRDVCPNVCSVLRQLFSSLEYCTSDPQYLADGLVSLFTDTVRLAGVDVAILDEG